MSATEAIDCLVAPVHAQINPQCQQQMARFEAKNRRNYHHATAIVRHRASRSLCRCAAADVKEPNFSVLIVALQP